MNDVVVVVAVVAGENVYSDLLCSSWMPSSPTLLGAVAPVSVSSN